MILYNHSLFNEDPLYKFHFEDFYIPENIILHLGDDPKNRIRNSSTEKHILIELEQPNKFLHPSSQYLTFECESFYDKILTIHPDFVKNRNKILNKDLYVNVFFPFSNRYIKKDFNKNYDIIYTGNVDYFNTTNDLRKHKLIWVGKHSKYSTHTDITHETKLQLTSESKISLSHSIVNFNDIIPFMNKHSESIGHVNGIFEQHKARTIEAAFNKSIILHIKTGQNIIEDIFNEKEDFLYYEDGLVETILNNYDSYKYLAENAYNKSMLNYTTEHFYNKYIKPNF